MLYIIDQEDKITPNLTNIIELEGRIHDKSYEVKVTLFAYKDLPIHFLEKLSYDEDYRIRKRLCLYENLPFETIVKLLNDNNRLVRMTMFQAYWLSKDVLQKAILVCVHTDTVQHLKKRLLNND